MTSRKCILCLTLVLALLAGATNATAKGDDPKVLAKELQRLCVLCTTGRVGLLVDPVTLQTKPSHNDTVLKLLITIFRDAEAWAVSEASEVCVLPERLQALAPLDGVYGEDDVTLARDVALYLTAPWRPESEPSLQTRHDSNMTPHWHYEVVTDAHYGDNIEVTAFGAWHAYPTSGSIEVSTSYTVGWQVSGTTQPGGLFSCGISGGAHHSHSYTHSVYPEHCCCRVKATKEEPRTNRFSHVWDSYWYYESPDIPDEWLCEYDGRDSRSGHEHPYEDEVTWSQLHNHYCSASRCSRAGAPEDVCDATCYHSHP